MKSGSYVEVARGAEGPRHDPYSYTEVTVHRADGREATIHGGLAEWMTYRDVTGATRRFEGDPWSTLRSKFIATVGIAPERAEQVPQKLVERRVDAHLRTCSKWKEARDCAGYPGETLLVCGCGEVLDGHFDRSAVE